MPVEIWVFWVFSFSPAWFGSCTSDPGTEVNCVELVWSVLWIDTDFDWKIGIAPTKADLPCLQAGPPYVQSTCRSSTILLILHRDT